MTLGILIATGVAGGVGTLMRYGVDRAVTGTARVPFPAGTLAVNLSAALLLGVLVGAAASGRTQTIVGSGLLGGYSTFSTWMLETVDLAGDRRRGQAIVNLVAGAGGGLLGFAIGQAVG